MGDDSKSVQSTSTTSSRASSKKGRGGRGRGGRGRGGRYNDHRGGGRGTASTRLQVEKRDSESGGRGRGSSRDGRGRGRNNSNRRQSSGRIVPGKAQVVRTASGNVEYHVKEDDPKTKGELLPNGTVRLSRKKKHGKKQQQHTTIRTKLEIGKPPDDGETK